jgi:hypothetical protein
MTPKDKANELFNRYYSYKWFNGIKIFSMTKQAAKECAIIAVDEIISGGIDIDYYYDKSIGYFLPYREYYTEVKNELLNLK